MNVTDQQHKKNKQRVSFINLVESSFENCDFLGTPIQLNFNGKNIVKSTPGSLVSIIISLLFIAYAFRRA